MGVVKTIVEALHTTHQTFATNGIHSRPLAELLLDMDSERYLNASDREDVIDKSVALAQVRVFYIPPTLADRPLETLPLKRASCRRSRCFARNPPPCPGYGRDGTSTAGE
jgi:hypothetical protein